MTDSDKPMLLPIEVQSLYTLEGEITRHPRVRCPVHTAVELEECLACERCEGLRTDPSGAMSVTCRIDGLGVSTAEAAPNQTGLSTAADTTPISEVMRHSVFCVAPDVKLESLRAFFLNQGISGAPVVDATGRPIGVVSKTDLVRAAHVTSGENAAAEDSVRRSIPGDATVADIMMPIAFVLPQNERLSRAAALMALEGVHRVPVVAANGKIVGIVTALDIVRWLAKQAGFIVGE